MHSATLLQQCAIMVDTITTGSSDGDKVNFLDVDPVSLNQNLTVKMNILNIQCQEKTTLSQKNQMQNNFHSREINFTSFRI